jgi:hypothetical protein
MFDEGRLSKVGLRVSIFFSHQWVGSLNVDV